MSVPTAYLIIVELAYSTTREPSNRPLEEPNILSLMRKFKKLQPPTSNYGIL